VSAPLGLTAKQLHDLADALNDLSRITKDHDVSLTPNGFLYVGVGDNVLRVTWDGHAEAYVIDDRNGD
jgi:hypothetical protein